MFSTYIAGGRLWELDRPARRLSCFFVEEARSRTCEAETLKGGKNRTAKRDSDFESWNSIGRGKRARLAGHALCIGVVLRDGSPQSLAPGWSSWTCEQVLVSRPMSWSPASLEGGQGVAWGRERKLPGDITEVRI